MARKEQLCQNDTFSGKLVLLHNLSAQGMGTQTDNNNFVTFCGREIDDFCLYYLSWACAVSNAICADPRVSLVPSDNFGSSGMHRLK
jgi:hypothetical protein